MSSASEWSAPLTSTDVSARAYGMKAAILARLAQEGRVRVPRGWAVSLHEHAVDEIERHGDLAAIWRDLGGGEQPLVVRSSASVEDLPFALFAGRFESRRDIRSFPQLLAAAKAVESSADGIAVTDYLAAFGLPRDAIRMSLIIQQQVDAKFSGVTFTKSPAGFARHEMFVELIEGPSARLLSGDKPGATFGLNRETEGAESRVEYLQLAGPEYESQDLTRLLPEVMAACDDIVRTLAAPQDIEWVWDGRSLWIVQSRELAAQSESEGFQLQSRSPGHVTPFLQSLPKSAEWGLKGAAAVYFGERGAANVLVVLPHSEASQIERDLARREEGNDGTVIRFSHRATVGLPKRFVPRGANVFQAFVGARTDPAWTGIVSDYVFIEGSFEAYVTSSMLLVEHVPGNWEPDNRLSPDIFAFTAEGSEFYRFTDYRQASVEAPNEGAKPHVVSRRVPPVSVATGTAWAERFVSEFRKIRADFRADLPLNVHFIADQNGNWHFLNIRPTADLEIAESMRVKGGEYKSNRFFTVSKPEDAQHWDGISKILVDAVADRGSESRIASVAVALRNAGVSTVYCTFGLLSHPAIVLREFHLRVEPLYIGHEVHKLSVAW